MKHTTTLSALLATAAFLAAPAVVEAQTSDSDDATVSVRVIQALGIANSGDLDLGTIVRGETAEVTSAADDAAGSFDVTGEGSERVTYTWDASVALSNGNGGSLSFSPTVWGHQASAPAGAPALTSGGAHELDGDGLFHIWLGGSVETETTDPTGTYTGTFTLSGAYTDV